MKEQEATVTQAFILSCVDRQDYEKGAVYARRGRVLAAIYEEETDGGVFFGEVQGTAVRPYSTEVKVIERNGRMLPKYTSCSCPLRSSCKHVAAMLISVMLKQTVSGRSKTHSTQPAWRQKLDGLLKNTVTPESQNVALLWEIREEKLYSSWYYTQHTASKPKRNLTIHPVRRSESTGKWVKNGISWRQLQYQDISGAARDQNNLLREFSKLFRISRTDQDYDDSYIKMDAFSSPLVWNLLDKMRNAGLPMLTAAPGNPEVVFCSPAQAETTLQENKDGSLKLSVRLKHDGKTIPKSTRRFIGQPPSGVYWFTAAHGNYSRADIHLARLDTTKEIAELAKDTSAINIPSSDKTAFADKVWPRLARRLDVKADKIRSIKLPDITPVKAMVDVSSHNRDITARVGFAYDDSTFLPYDGEVSDDPQRDRVQEASALKSLSGTVAGETAWFDDTTGHLRPAATFGGAEAVRFMRETIPKLQANPNILMHLDKDLPDYTELTGPPQISYELEEGGDASDWFNLGIQITVDNRQLPFEDIFTALAEGEEVLIMPDGSYLYLNHPELDKLRKLITEARQLNDKESGLGLSRFQAGLWEELRQLGVVTKQAEAWDAAVRGLLDVKHIPDIPVLKTLKASLRPYQYEGFRWMAFLWQHRLGGVLADDMGLGKTIQSIALMLHAKSRTAAKDRRPVLIVAPTSVAANWVGELQKFAPSLKTTYLQKTAKTTAMLKRRTAKADAVVTSYALFRLNGEAYRELDWSMLILDEAQFVKNHQSQGYQAARKLNAPFKLVLTGTPMENNLMELWSLLSIVAPGLFPSPKKFEDFYRKPIEKQADAEKLADLRQRVRPLMLRRTKEQVVSELPPKTEQVIEVELDPKHRKIYDTYLQRERQRVLGLLGDMDKNRFLILKSLTTLRQLSLSAALVDAKKHARVPSAKLTELIDRLRELNDENHRVLVFSQFTRYLGQVRKALNAEKIDHLYLDGKTKNRAELLESFKNSDVPVFVISLKAGGFGLNLTEAGYCFLLDPWWNPAVERQAVDRTHRIGQTKQVMIYRLVAKDTIEEKVMALRDKKAKLFASLMDKDAAFSSAVTAEDIKTLFS